MVAMSRATAVGLCGGDVESYCSRAVRWRCRELLQSGYVEAVALSRADSVKQSVIVETVVMTRATPVELFGCCSEQSVN